MAKEMLLKTYFKRLRIPTVFKTYPSVAREAADRKQTFEKYLFCLMDDKGGRISESCLWKNLMRS